MKYYKQRFNPMKKVSEMQIEKEEINKEEFHRLCETKEAYFISHIRKENTDEIEGHQVHIVDLLL